MAEPPRSVFPTPVIQIHVVVDFIECRPIMVVMQMPIAIEYNTQ
jgi:hypothetical protein